MNVGLIFCIFRIGNVELSSGARESTGLGRAVYVEKCECPPGYSGLSCQVRNSPMLYVNLPLKVSLCYLSTCHSCMTCHSRPPHVVCQHAIQGLLCYLSTCHSCMSTCHSRPPPCCMLTCHYRSPCCVSHVI